jgi:hypothetical protein
MKRDVKVGDMIELPGVKQQQLVVEVAAGGQPTLEAASTFVTMPIYLQGSAHHVSNHQRPKRWVNYPLADIALAGTCKFKADVQVTYSITKVSEV